MRKILFLFCCLMGVFLAGCTNVGSDSDIVLNDTLDVEGSKGISDENCSTGYDITTALPEQENVVVYVCGAVVCPGVYELPPSSRVGDAVDAAGGFAEGADETFVNLAAKAEDGTKLMIPTKDEVMNGIADEFSGAAAGSSGNGLVNINTATKEELKTIPGIGEKVAGKIVDFRTQNGKFTCIEDIMKVSGIKDKLFSKIKEFITV
ncbi:MAG: ComEA family DNA-binding protein [Butyrivibrio sp.]|uniref:ComEA family DNA-binding protein n=1 Tax=Butyrivibrio sp. TaxID=28121 RepID=UPI001B175451|nr:ComEA family DNA-binding protein [Butyrivibrio sp.]MBO6240245.1 ComEA family DNA-binding protein [Butyrivibrio sp.]